MDEHELYEVLWGNVTALMKKRYGQERMGQFAAEVGIGASSMTRMKAKNTAVGVDILLKIATTFELLPWQLLAPNLGDGLYFLRDGRILPVLHSETPNLLTHPAPEDSKGRRDDAWKRTQAGKTRDANTKPSQPRRRIK